MIIKREAINDKNILITCCLLTCITLADVCAMDDQSTILLCEIVGGGHFRQLQEDNTKEQGLIQACIDGDEKASEHWISAGANVNIAMMTSKEISQKNQNMRMEKRDTPYVTRRTPLMYMIKNNWLENARLLLQNDNLNLRITDHQGENALMMAVRGGNVDLVKFLAQKSDVNALNHKGETALTIAVLYGDCNIAFLLIPIMEYYSCEESVLMLAKNPGREMIVHSIVVNISKKEGCSKVALALAVRVCDIDTVQCILDEINKKEELSYCKRIALINAVYYNREQTTKSLIENMTDEDISELAPEDNINMPCEAMGKSPLIIAVLLNKPVIVNLLLSKMSAENVGKPDSEELTALMHTGINGNLTMARMLVPKMLQKDINAKKNRDKKMIDLQRMAFESGLFTCSFVTTNVGYNALMFAKDKQHLEVEEFLKGHMDAEEVDSSYRFLEGQQLPPKQTKISQEELEKSWERMEVNMELRRGQINRAKRYK